LPDGPEIEALGAVRLRFEQDRLSGERQEADALVEVLTRDVARHLQDSKGAEAELRDIEVELAPARRAVSAVAQAEISAMDVALGQAAERRRQVDRVAAALELGKSLTVQIQNLETKITPLAEKVDEQIRAVDFGDAAQRLEDGMNLYLSLLNRLRPEIWKHNAVQVDLSRSSFTIRVGSKRWQGALGGTDTLYFLMAYQFGLLALSRSSSTHYPGLSIIDVPGEFSGEAIEDKENFIVQPFIDLLGEEGFEGAQLIITGASFTGLAGVHLQKLTQVHVA
jgi:hypothetical protein